MEQSRLYTHSDELYVSIDRVENEAFPKSYLIIGDLLAGSTVGLWVDPDVAEKVRGFIRKCEQ